MKQKEYALPTGSDIQPFLPVGYQQQSATYYDKTVMKTCELNTFREPLSCPRNGLLAGLLSSQYRLPCSWLGTATKAGIIFRTIAGRFPEITVFRQPC